MRKIKWKFEYLFALILLGILAGALIGAFWMKDKDLINMLLMTFAGGFSAIISFMFTKHRPGGKDEDDKDI